MPSSAHLLTLAAAAVSSASAFHQGFNYGASFSDGKAKSESDFVNEFKTAASLSGTGGSFQSARLFTMVQAGSTDDPISAIPAAIQTKTGLLLGLWASAGDAQFANELSALQRTVLQYCGQLEDLVQGISVGSEDLYRISPTGMEAGENPGASPDTLVKYIKQTRDAIKGTCMQNVPIGHVDTWTAYVNETNKPVVDNLDWVGMDAYPFFESQKSNDISNGKKLFEDALANTRNAVGGREIWVTETGWPVSGKPSGAAVASVENAEIYWKEVACSILGNMNVWWYILQDGAPIMPDPSFGLVGAQLTNQPMYDLSCRDVKVLPRNVSEPPSGTTSSHAAMTTGISHDDSVMTRGSNATMPPYPNTNSTDSPQQSHPAIGSSNFSMVATPTGGVAFRTTGGGGALPTGPGSVPSTDNNGNTVGQPTVSLMPVGGSNQLDSLSAAAVALVLAAAML